ncbi:MAG: ferredoxin [Candidatus Omnitrophota bacterium]|jgi:ferredoxin
MKAVVDQEKCIGCGLCAQVAPDIYEMQGDKAVAKVEEVPEDKADDAKNGAEQCPVDAISVS